MMSGFTSLYPTYKLPDFKLNILLVHERDMDQHSTSRINKNNEDFSPENIPKWVKLFALGSAWLLITFVLYWKWSDLATEQFYLYFLYPLFSAYVIVGAWYQGWYLVTFRIAVGRPKFFFTVFVEIFLVVLTMMAAERGYERGQLFLIIIIFSIIHIGLVVALYRNAIRVHG